MAKKKATLKQAKATQSKIRAKARRRAGSAANADENRKARQKTAIKQRKRRRARLGVVTKPTAEKARSLSSSRAKGSMSLGRQLRRATQAGDRKKAAAIRKKIGDRLVKQGLAKRNAKGAAVLNRRKGSAAAQSG